MDVRIVLPADDVVVRLQHPTHQEVIRVVPRLGLQRWHKVRGPLPPVVPDAVLHSRGCNLLHILVPTRRLVPLEAADEVDVPWPLFWVHLQATSVIACGRSREQRTILLNRHELPGAVQRRQPHRWCPSKLGGIAHLVQKHALVVVSIGILWKSQHADHGPHSCLILTTLNLQLLGQSVGLCLVVRGFQSTRELAQVLTSLVKQSLFVHSTILVVPPQLVKIRCRREGQLFGPE
mmetsp:Transcript_11835/g.42311  ORF Transcript_11835/g.42311 Transcript_11835/m.42311 type:complete len:234 (+) Transcript_11835:774-1475(+)